MATSDSNEEKIRTLLDTHSYNSNMIPPLEDYLRQMCAGTAPYSWDAVRTLVKCYTLFPNSTTTEKKATLDHMGLACLLALTYGSGNNNIVALRFLIPTTLYLHNDDGSPPLLIAQVMECATLYDAAKFVDFWKLYTVSFVSNPSADAVRSVATAAMPTLQRSILTALSISFQQAPTALVLAALNTSDMKELSAISTDIVEQSDADTVTFVRTADNTQRHRSFQENISYSTLSNLLYDPSKTKNAMAQ
jgi:hypothetical protein